VRHDPLADESFARGVAALTAHNWAKAANLLHLALDLEPDRLDAQLGLLRALGNIGDTGLLPLAHRLLAQAGREPDTMLAARVHQALGLFHLNNSDLAQADHHLGLALECAAGQGGAGWTAGMLLLQAGTAADRLDYERAHQIIGHMYEQCERSGDRLLPVAGLVIEANAAASGGNLEQAVVLSREAARRARAFRLNSYVVAANDNTALYLAKLGRLAEAAVHAEESVTAALSVENWAHAWRSMPTLCWIYRLAGAPEAARRALDRMPDPLDLPGPAHVWRSRALVAAAEGRHTEAADELVRAVRTHRELENSYDEEQTLPWLVDALVLSRRLDEAEAELEAATAPHLSGSDELKVRMLHGRALLAHARGDVEEAMVCLAQVADAVAAPLWRAWASIDLAWLQAQAGQIDAATRLLDRVPLPLADHPLVRTVRACLGTQAVQCVPMQSLPTRR
jgi:tetratricopeptide (TPR) repeat protein